MFRSLLQKYREIYSSKNEITPVEQDLDTILQDIQSNKDIIKSLAVNELIDEDEYLTKLQTLVVYENEIRKSEAGEETKSFADVVVLNEKAEILLLQRSSESKMFPGLWGLPGGHIDKGENAIEAAKRELKEETGLETEFLIPVLETKLDNGSTISYFLTTKKFGSQTTTLENREHYNQNWFSEEKRKAIKLLPNLEENIAKILEQTKPTIVIHEPEDIIKIFTQNENNSQEHLSELAKDNLRFLQNKPYTLVKSCFDNNLISEETYLNYIVKGGEGSGPRKTGDMEIDSEPIKEKTSLVGEKEFKTNRFLVKQELDKQREQDLQDQADKQEAFEQLKKKTKEEDKKQEAINAARYKKNQSLRDQETDYHLPKKKK